MPFPVTAVIIGAGSRGSGYSKYALEKPDLFQIVGVAEPRAACRTSFVSDYNIPPENVFKDWNEVAEHKKLADCVIIATPDRMHKEPAVAFAKKGYHILLEKPMAVSEDDCRSIVETSKENGIILAVCHVLRYLPQTQRIKRLIDAGVIGDVVNIQLTEPVGYWHFAHSFVRGNWRNERESTFSLLAKSCHDIDLINYWMSPHKCIKVASFGNLAHFTKDNKPAGAGDRCIDCSIEADCPYSAKKLYLHSGKGWPTSVICDGDRSADIEDIMEALRVGPYGRCVYECDNDVMSNQVVQFEFERNKIATFTMIAFSQDVCVRQVQVFGSRGEITAQLSGDHPVVHKDFVTGKTVEYNDDEEDSKTSSVKGHGGADYYLVSNFVNAIGSEGSHTNIVTGPEETLTSHLLVFAAERARRENRVIML